MRLKISIWLAGLCGAPALGSNYIAATGNIGDAPCLCSRSGSAWSESRQFITSDPGPNNNERGGETLAIAGDEVFVGVPGDDSPEEPSETQHGSVLIYSDVPPDCDP